MISVQKLRKKPRHFERLVGLSGEQFDDLLRAVRPVYAEREAQRLSRPERQRARGGGRRFALRVEERLLATLLYYRLYVTGTLLSYLFDLDESNLCRERRERMLPVLAEVLPTPLQDHLLSAVEAAGEDGDKESKDRPRKPRKRISTLEELLRAHPELEEVCIDATEQELPKPRQKGRRKAFYSGKSHCHTVKSQITSCGRLILHVYGGCAGALADRWVLKASGVLRSLSKAGVTLKRDRVARLDRGYSGIEKEKAYKPLEGVRILAALKGTSKSKVTVLGKLWNRVMVARKRMQVEQNIGHLKNWRILSSVYRGPLEQHPALLSVVAGLHNFRQLGTLAW